MNKVGKIMIKEESNIFYSNGSILEVNPQNGVFEMAVLNSALTQNPVVGNFTQVNDKAQFTFNGTENKILRVSISGQVFSDVTGTGNITTMKLAQSGTNLTGSEKDYEFGVFGDTAGYTIVGYGDFAPGDTIDMFLSSNNNAMSLSLINFIIEITEV